MLNIYPNQVTAIEQIIERTRREEEAFLHDTQKAAVNILQYLTNEGMLAAKVIQMETLSEAKTEFY